MLLLGPTLEVPGPHGIGPTNHLTTGYKMHFRDYYNFYLQGQGRKFRGLMAGNVCYGHHLAEQSSSTFDINTV